jgi:hypothetical protein
MTAQNHYQGNLEGTQYVANIQAPGTPGEITYYPSKSTPDFEKRMKRDRIVGSVVAMVGFSLITLGFAMAFNLLGFFLLPVILAAVFAIVFIFLFVGLKNPALVKTAKALPIVGYLTLLVLWIFLIPFLVSASMASAMESMMADFAPMNGGSVPMPDFGQIMGEIMGVIGIVLLSTFITIIGLMCMRGGAGVLLDSYRLRTDFSPSIIVMSLPAGLQGTQPGQPSTLPPPPPTVRPTGGTTKKGKKQASTLEKKAEIPEEKIPEDQTQPDQPPPPPPD